MTKHVNSADAALSESSLRTTRATPDDAFRKARDHWLKGERIHLASLAVELNIGRATLFRWVGNKDLLLGEILWSLYAPLRERARRKVSGNGIEHVVGVYHRINATLLNDAALRRFISQDPEYALRILTSASSTIHNRVVQANTRMLWEQIDAGHLKQPAMKTESLSYFMVRLAESCLYSDVICGREPQEEELEEACKAVRILLGGQPG
ncbi:QsdR family transcriptional regulator [Marinobacter fonticola]|uniref:QsdR family transcriptional regulator n=1 Tax=Marinobacter fonticola TaxID=2603215 RepID=UPI001930F737|nr:QsdR family transcriptional regulator [Marinobacter fonticola]